MANPACSFFVIDTTVPFRSVEVRGNAVIEPDDDRSLLAKMVEKYMPGRDGPDEDRVRITIDPVRVNVMPAPGGWGG